jgi:hypothetical protein
MARISFCGGQGGAVNIIFMEKRLATARPRNCAAWDWPCLKAQKGGSNKILEKA